MATRIRKFPTNIPPDRPVIQFSCKPYKTGETDGETRDLGQTVANAQQTSAFGAAETFGDIDIFFPCPGNISFSDTANYQTGSADMISTLLQKMTGTGDTLSAAGDILAGGVDAITGGNIDILKDQMKKGFGDYSGADAAAALGAAAPGDAGQEIQFETKTIMDPRINTRFTGNGMRNFSFNFKMIATSEQESIIVKDIYNAFRRYSYAKRIGAIALSYPPLWTIRFLIAPENGAKENPFIPKIGQCYLNNVGTTFNSTNNSWRTNNAPLEVDLTLAFQETQVQTRDDISELEKDNVDRTGGGKVGFLNSLQGNFKKSVNKKLDSLKNEVRDVFRF